MSSSETGYAVVASQQAKLDKRPSAWTRKWRLRTKYGLSEDGLDRMVSEQDGKCAICHAPFGPKVCVDHDHKTGIVRGLLCSPCNIGLGLFKDDPERLREAARYLAPKRGRGR